MRIHNVDITQRKEANNNMTMAENLLRGMVFAKYGSCEKFAKELNWSGRKTRDIVSGRQIPTAKDITQMAHALNVWNNPEVFMSVFFANSVHNVDC